jgi:methylmalonyl-CoA mutase, C-terminal domain
MEWWSNGVLGGREFQPLLQYSTTPSGDYVTTRQSAKRKRTTSDSSKRLRVLVAKVGLDGHDRGVKIVARALRDAGVEVVYLGIHNTAEEIVRSALQEDVDAIGLSIHSAAHLTLFKEVATGLKKNKASDIVIFGGGIVPDADMPVLKKLGVRKIFTPGASLDEIVRFVKGLSGRN